MGGLGEKAAGIAAGNGGIGLAAAQGFVKAGAYVFIAGRRHGELDKAAAAAGKDVTAVQNDSPPAPTRVSGHARTG